MTKTAVCDWDLLPVLLDIKTLCCVLRISRPLALRLIERGEIPAKKVGREWRIPKEAIKQFFEI